MSIYSDLLKTAQVGGGYKIDLTKKNLWIGRKQIIKEGVVLIDKDLICNEDFEEFDIFTGDVASHSWKNMMWHLYNIFKYSVPNSGYKDTSKFIAVPVEELQDGDLAYGMDRYVAQAMLEGYLLLGRLANWFQWQDDGRWFWQHETLVVLKEWF
jgi:hypothetical protein